MTPEFARAVDPVILHMVRLLDRISDGENPLPQEERVRIGAVLAEADARMGSNPEWDLARYGLVAWIDEMLVEAPWSGKEWWSNNVLEMELFSTRNCYEKFFVKAKQASGLSQRNALEVFYLCVMLGFRGCYDDPELAQPFVQSQGLPEDLDIWAQQTAMGIRLGAGRPTMQQIPRPIAGAPPRVSRERAVWPWVFAAITVPTAILLCYIL